MIRRGQCDAEDRSHKKQTNDTTRSRPRQRLVVPHPDRRILA
jgi:hypothetical protein